MAVILGGVKVGSKITTNYRGQELNLIAGEGTLNWNSYPVRITDAELRTLNAERILAIMQGNDLTPSSLAGLKSDQIVCQPIHLIDVLYRSAIQDYKQRLAQASGEDLKQIRALLEQHKWAPIQTSGGAAGVGLALGATIGIPLGPPGIIVGGAVGALIGLLSGFFAGKKLTERMIEREGSAHRVKWMHTIDVLEDVRFKQIFKNICNASVSLVEDLIQLEQQSQTDKHKVKQLHQLFLVHRAIFNEVPLEITLDPNTPNKKIDVAQYMQTLTQKFTALKWDG